MSERAWGFKSPLAHACEGPGRLEPGPLSSPWLYDPVMRLRRVHLLPLVSAAVITLMFAGCSPEDEAEDNTGDVAAPDECATDDLPLKSDGVLTIGTDSPAFEPWFVDNDPSNGEGFESAVAYAVAEELGFSADQVTWIKVGFNGLFKPGGVDFDFDINQVSIIPAKRDKVVDFSEGYYSAAQAVITLKDSPAVSAASLEELQGSEARGADRHHLPFRDPRHHPAGRGASRLRGHQRRQAGDAERAGRRDPGRPAHRVLHQCRGDSGQQADRAVPAGDRASRSSSGIVVRAGERAAAVRQSSRWRR